MVMVLLPPSLSHGVAAPPACLLSSTPVRRSFLRDELEVPVPPFKFVDVRQGGLSFAFAEGRAAFTRYVLFKYII